MVRHVLVEVDLHGARAIKGVLPEAVTVFLAATATKAATGVTTDAPIVVTESDHGPDYVSRGAHKLAGEYKLVPWFRGSGQEYRLLDQLVFRCGRVLSLGCMSAARAARAQVGRIGHGASLL